MDRFIISRLKEILDSRGIKQKWLCEKVEISSSAMSQIVRGDSEPTLVTALKISEVLGVPVNDIWRLNDN
jgi:putative transcriptional regulator